MLPRFPDSLEDARIDLEINFGDRGGIQRFKTIGQLNSWIAEEQQFWHWFNSARPALGRYADSFWNFSSSIDSEIKAQMPRWHQLINERNQQESLSQRADLSAHEKNSLKEQIDGYHNQCQILLDQLNNRITSHFQTEIVDQKRHFFRTEPESTFVAQIAESDVVAASHALAYFFARRNNEQGEFKGKLLASLYDENLNRKIRHDQAAFKNAIQTWTEELKDFKTRYETQEIQFQEISQNHQASEDAWKIKHDHLAADFTAMREKAEQELKTLKDTYDAFMQLEAPRTYWEKKREEHAKGKKHMGWASGVAAFLGAGILGFAAWFLLPHHHPTATVPWRQIGFFFLASTFVLWFVRLFVRLMLSHIHLYADAREREVMISTFLALIHRQESREGLKKEDIALVLAPIFRPSTTGVIKDDGGPQSFGDLLSALTAGRK